MRIAFGARGEQVKDLQQSLNYLGSYRNALRVDGIFGPKTHARVKEFQRQAKVAGDGIVGPITGKALVFKVLGGILGSQGRVPGG